MNVASPHSFSPQGNVAMQNYEDAVTDLKVVLAADPKNGAARNLLATANQKIKQQRDKEKKIYGGMFTKFAEIDAKVSMFEKWTSI